MKNKGYTLLELLGVIVILSVLVTLVFPSVINFIKKGNDTKNNITNELIISAAEDYINDNSSSLYLTIGDEHCVSIATLIGKNYLDNELIEEELYTSKSIKVTYTDKYNYELVDSSSCKSVEIIKFLRYYTPVEYIESTGTQWIDTGYTPTLNTKARVKFAPIKTNGSSFFGARKDPYRFTVVTHSQGSYFSFTMANGTFSTNRTAVVLNKIYDCIVENGKQIINGVEYVEPVVTEWGNPGTFLLSTVNNYGIIDMDIPNLNNSKFYLCQLWENNILVRDMIPCYRKNDGVIGMYDLVEGKFYTNAGTGEFLKGEEVEI